MLRATILGGTGYGGMELLRLLLGHPGVEVTAVTSRSQDGPVGEVHPHLAGYTDLRFTKEMLLMSVPGAKPYFYSPSS